MIFQSRNHLSQSPYFTLSRKIATNYEGARMIANQAPIIALNLMTGPVLSRAEEAQFFMRIVTAPGNPCERVTYLPFAHFFMNSTTVKEEKSQSPSFFSAVISIS